MVNAADATFLQGFRGFRQHATLSGTSAPLEADFAVLPIEDAPLFAGRIRSCDDLLRFRLEAIEESQ